MPIAGLIILNIAFIACSLEDTSDPPEPFVLGDNDYALDCDHSGDSVEAWACQLAYYTNRERRAHPEESDQAAPLDWSWELADVASAYSRRMCEDDFFDHKDPQGNGIEVRLYEAGITYVKAGENLARGANLYPGEAMALFMDEAPCQLNHRGNVLDNDFTHVGVGTVFCDVMTIYTQLFATFSADDLRDDPNEFCGE